MIVHRKYDTRLTLRLPGTGYQVVIYLRCIVIQPFSLAQLIYSFSIRLSLGVTQAFSSQLETNFYFAHSSKLSFSSTS